MSAACAGEGVQAAANQAGSKVGGAIDSVKGLATEAADTAHAAGERAGRVGTPVSPLPSAEFGVFVSGLAANSNNLSLWLPSRR